MAWTKRYCRADSSGGGDGTTSATSGANAAWTWAEALTNAAGGHKVIVMGAGGTSSRSTNSDNFTNDGTTTAPIWFAGCNSAEDDLDNDYTTTPPIIDFTTGHFIPGKDFYKFSNLRFNSAAVTGSSPGTVNIQSTALANAFHRCQFINTAANANSSAMRDSGRAVFEDCYFIATSSANVVVTTTDTLLSGCYISGGLNGVSSGAGRAITNCIITGAATDGILVGDTNVPLIMGNVIYGCGQDGIRCNSMNTFSPLSILNNIIVSNTRYGINNSSGANTAMWSLDANSFYGNGTAETNGLGDTPQFHSVTESAAPFVNAAGGDFRLLSTALSYQTASPRRFENTSLINYLSRGALQPAGAGLKVHGGMTGGFQA